MFKVNSVGGLLVLLGEENDQRGVASDEPTAEPPIDLSSSPDDVPVNVPVVEETHPPPKNMLHETDKDYQAYDASTKQLGSHRQTRRNSNMSEITVPDQICKTPAEETESSTKQLGFHRQTRRNSNMSEVTFPDQMCKTPTEETESTQTEDQPSPNHAHPSLEFPPLYYILKKYPRILEGIQRFYRFRWNVQYPLQRRVVFSDKLRKFGVYLTWGELLLLCPFIAAIIMGVLYSFVYPSVAISGHACRTPLILAFATAMRNSFFTLLLGIPFERALFYHKLAGRIAFVVALLHGYVAFVHPEETSNDNSFETSYKGQNTDFVAFSFSEQVMSSGTALALFLIAIVATSVPYIRRRVFELFFYLHVLFALAMIVCAFYHTGVLIPAIASVCWGSDLVVRKLVMAGVRHPKSAAIRIVSESVIELSFPKTDSFDFNPGQYILIAVPELSIFQWHPFSLSSCPRQKVVTLHIRKSGAWTTALYKLAKQKKNVSILFEGPYGSVGVDLFSDRYKMVMLLSGGIGVTPMQSISNQLFYEQSKKERQLKKLSFVWIERDPNIIEEVQLVRRASNHGETFMNPGENEGPQGIATTCLALAPGNNISDQQLEEDYRIEQLDDFDEVTSYCDGSVDLDLEAGRLSDEDVPNMADNYEPTMEEAFSRQNSVSSISPFKVLDLQVYLTGRNAAAKMELPFVHKGRPDIRERFRKMREDAIAEGESLVAVCVCAPVPFVRLCHDACIKYSDAKVHFDFHQEVFG